MKYRLSRLAAVTVLGLILAGLPGTARAQSDNFNDGNDNGWRRVDPLGDLGLVGLASWKVTNGAYQIRCEGQELAYEAGKARAGSIWTNAAYTYTNFYVSADVTDWSTTTNIAIGLLARIQDPINLGVTAGYSLTYEPKVKDFQISTLDFGGGFSQTVFTNIDLPSTNIYRFVFLGRGDYLEGRVYLVSDLSTPIATISATEPTWQSGYSGLLAFNSQGTYADPVQATFDNYLALREEPPVMTIQRNGTQVQLGWPSWANAFQLQRTANLVPPLWSPVTSGIVSNANGFSYSAPATDQNFFRLILN